jgi:hypothetical protein
VRKKRYVIKTATRQANENYTFTQNILQKSKYLFSEDCYKVNARNLQVSKLDWKYEYGNRKYPENETNLNSKSTTHLRAHVEQAGAGVEDKSTV